MNTQEIEFTYHSGDVVYAKINPSLKLVIRRYIDRVYYCTISDHPEKKELVYYKRELVEDPLLLLGNSSSKREAKASSEPNL